MQTKICIDDLHAAVSNTTRMFADHDTKLFTQGDTVAQEAAVQDNRDSLCYLIRSWDWQGPSKVQTQAQYTAKFCKKVAAKKC